MQPTHFTLKSGVPIKLGTILRVGDEGHGQWRAIYEVINFRQGSRLEGIARAELSTLRLFRGQEVPSITKKELEALYSKNALQVLNKDVPLSLLQCVKLIVKSFRGLTFYKKSTNS